LLPVALRAPFQVRELADCDHTGLRPFYARGDAFSVTHVTSTRGAAEPFWMDLKLLLFLQRFEIVNDAVNFNGNAALGI
jgi:hypothetical protein